MASQEPELIVPKNPPTTQTARPETPKPAEPKAEKAEPAPKAKAKKGDTSKVVAKANLIHPTTGAQIRHNETVDIPHADAKAWTDNNLAEYVGYDD